MAGSTQYVTVPAGTPVRACSKCTKPVYWVDMPSGRRMPVSCDFDAQCVAPHPREDGRGVSHFANCPYASSFRKKR